MSGHFSLRERPGQRMRTGAWALPSCTCCSSCPGKTRGQWQLGSTLLTLLCPSSSSYQGSFPGLCHSQRSHHSFTSGLAALDNCLFCLHPNLPKATQRWRLHPNSRSQYSSLTTRPSSLSSFSGTYCLGVYAKYSIVSCKTRFPSPLSPASKGYVHLLF